MIHSVRIGQAGAIGIAVSIAAGCAGPGPSYFPAAAFELRQRAAGGQDRLFDTDTNGTADYAERLEPNGRVSALLYDADGDGVLEDQVVLAAVPAGERRDLVLILDSVPFDHVRSAHAAGRLAFFEPPTRVISPFPVMTDLSLAEFFGASPCPGVEASYYDGTRVTDGYDHYVHEGNTPWLPFTDYRMAPIAHLPTYLWPLPWFDHELRAIEGRLLREPTPSFVGYCVGTSAIGASLGHDGHAAALVRLDRYVSSLMFQTRGRLRISAFSDHGHLCGPSRRVSLGAELAKCGYRIVEKLERPDDVVSVEFGLVSCGALHTRQPESVARDVVSIEGVDLAAYRGPAGGVMVRSRAGQAVIESNGDRLQYRLVSAGDPLGMSRGVVCPPQGWSRNEAFEQTRAARVPDGVHRLWRAINGLLTHTPDVLVSFTDGYHSGSPTMEGFVSIVGVHGSLGTASSAGFAISMATGLPEEVPMDQLRAAFAQAGIRIRGVDPIPSAQTTEIRKRVVLGSG